MEEVIPLHSDSSEAGFRLYTLDISQALGLQEEEPVLTVAQVVLTRQDGLLLALPELAISADISDVGNQEDAQGLVGPSTRVEVVCAALDEEAIALPPALVEGRTLTVLLVDFTNDVIPFLKVLSDKDMLESVHAFEILDPLIVPHGADLVARALAWASSEEATDARIQFYAADDVPETPTNPETRRRAKPRRAGADPGGSGAPKTAAKKRPTVHQLAESLELITKTLPTITEQLQDLTIRTEAMEKGIQTHASRPSALRAPLGSLALSGSAKASSPASLVKEMPPPRSTSGQPAARVTFLSAGDRGVGGGPTSPEQRPCQGHVGAIKSHHGLGISDSWEQCRPSSRLGLGIFLPVEQGGPGQTETPSRACGSSRHFLHECPAINVQEDAPSDERGCWHVRSERQGSDTYTVPREVWWLWQNKGCRDDHMAGGIDYEPSPGGQCSSGERCDQSVVCMLGTDGTGWREHAGGASAVADRRPSGQPLLGEVNCDGLSAQAVCTNSQSAMGHNSASVPHGDGRDCHSQTGCHRWKEPVIKGRPRTTSKSQHQRRRQKEEARGKLSKRRSQQRRRHEGWLSTVAAARGNLCQISCLSTQACLVFQDEVLVFSCQDVPHPSIRKMPIFRSLPYPLAVYWTF